ncbi:MFS transporter [Flavobacterium sp.]|uniref:MFS transporter n=1 Tax=Flavobacterium sp. TaxID=239 RepID=UPI00262FE7D4|nr:MFS transporter [Flavobacterium sp.]
MIKITNQTHPKETFLYAISRVLERASYYGIRALILIYMIDSLNLPEQDASKIYGFFIGALVFTQIFGALLGDLVLGNKKAMLIGGILQALGSFTLCIPSVMGLYIGLGLILLGSGLYSSNILSQFGKLYLNKKMLIDSGFSIFYLVTSLGAMIGGFAIMHVLEFTNYQFGFIFGGILMLLSVLICYFIKEKKEADETINYKIDFDKRLLTILAFILIIAVYWGVYDYSSNGFVYLDYQFSESYAMSRWIPNLFTTFSIAFLLPFGIIASIIWAFWYNSQLTKITTGFVLGAIALLILLFIPEPLGDSSVLIFIFSMFLLNLAEIHIAPILYSILTVNSNPKYLATIISLSFIPIRIFSYLISPFIKNSTGGLFSIMLGAIILSIIAAVLIIAMMVKKRDSKSGDFS